MTEAEALDLAAKAAGWDDWDDACRWALSEDTGIRAHAKTLMENARLEQRVRELEEAGPGVWVPAEQFIAIRKELERATKFIGAQKHTKRGYEAYTRARKALGEQP